MKMWVRFGLVFVLGVVVVLPAIVTAQDDEPPCNDDMFEVAQAVYDAAGDLKGQARIDTLRAAFWLAAQGESRCVLDPDRFVAAQELRQSAASRLDRMLGSYFEPGEIEMADFGLFLVCMGEGSPTVIFENGLDVDADLSWQDIQPAISTVTRTCRYDRRNIGLSQFSAMLKHDDVRTLRDQVDDLTLLLETAEIDPPYVLVGWSWGGLIDLLFTDTHPEWVQGVVLTEASHPKQLETLNLVLDPTFCDGPQSDRTAASQERVDFCDFHAQVGHVRTLGDRPLAVVTAVLPPPNAPDEIQDLWLELQEDYVTFSTNSRHIVLENSNHFFQAGKELNLVIDAILWVVEEARTAEEQ